MRQFSMMESKAGKIAFGLFLFAMLLLARDTLITSCLLGFNKSQFLMLGLICAFGLAFLAVNRRSLKEIVLDRRMIAVAASAVILLLPMVVKQDWQMMYFSILICLFFAVFLTYFTSYREVSKYYVVILCGLGLYSVIATYLLKGFAADGTLQVPVFYNSNDWEFYNFGLSYVVTWELWYRNFGIFREPGVYQFFILLAVFLNNYAVDWKKTWQLWLCNVILAVTMFTTFAIGGFAELGLFVLFLYFDKKWYKEKWGKIAAVTAVLAVIALIAFIIRQYYAPGFEFTIYYEFYDMFLRLFTKSDSSTDRLDAILVNAEFFLRNPVFGDTVANILHGTNHNTSSTLILYAMFGILGGTLNVAAWVALAWKKERNVIGNLILLVILFMSFNTQNLVADVFFWLFPMMALVERGLPLLKLPAKKV